MKKAALRSRFFLCERLGTVGAYVSSASNSTLCKDV